MTGIPRIDAVFPNTATELDDDAIAALYERSDRSTPWLRVNFVSSVDGAATHSGLSGGLGTAADKRVFNIVRRLGDVVVVGAGTVRAEKYGPMRLERSSVEWRTARGLPPHPVFVIVSRSLDLDADSAIFRDAPARVIVATTERAPGDRRRALAEVADILVCGDDAVDPDRLVSALVAAGHRQIHCEGGPSLFGDLIRADVVDEVCLTVSPRLESGDAGRIAVGSLTADRPLHLGNVLVSGDTMLVRYTREPGQAGAASRA